MLPRGNHAIVVASAACVNKARRMEDGLADPHLSPLVRATNETDLLLRSDDPSDIQAALRVSCGFLRAVGRTNSSINAGGIRLPVQVDFADWAWRRLSTQPGGLNPTAVFSVPEEAERFFATEAELLRRAGVNPDVVDWYIRHISDKSARLWDTELGERRLRRAVDNLRAVVCEQVSLAKATTALLADIPLPAGFGARRGVVFAMTSVVATVANATMMPTTLALWQGFSMGAGASGFVAAAYDLYDAIFKPRSK